jgi:8-oxo-dGTP pyrophosphatase MutT (NUDIX family)
MSPDKLRSLLEGYGPADPREAEFVDRMRALLTHPAPLSRSTFEPGHFTASAFVLSPDQNSLLLIFHKKLGLWLQPGGHIDPTDEGIEEASRREVAEEVGLAALERLDPLGPIFDVDIHAIPARPKEPAHEHFDVRFAFVAGSLDVRLNAEVRESQWVALSAVESVTTDRSVIRAAEKLRRRGGAW